MNESTDFANQRQIKVLRDRVIKNSGRKYNGLPYLVIGDKRLVEEAFEDNYDIYYSNNGMICGTNENKKWREFLNEDDISESIIMTFDEIEKVFGKYVAEPIFYRGDCGEFS